MSGWESRLWPTKGGVGRLPYRSRVPSPIADTEFRFTEVQSSLARDCQVRLEAWCDDLSTHSCDRFLHLAEAAGSSTIEGITPAPRRIFRAEVTRNERAKDNVKAALRNIAAVRTALDVGLSAGTLTTDDICSVHATLTDGLPQYPAETHPPGSFRSEQNWIGGSNRLLDDMGPAHPAVKFVPPRPELVQPLIDDLLAFAARTDIHPIPQAAIFHARFEEIHPFIDGNGRTGRALVHTLWAKRGLVTRPTSIPVSSSLARHVGDYETALAEFQTHEGEGDAGLDVAASPIADVFLICTSDALTRASHVNRRFARLRSAWREKLNVRRGSLIDRVLAHLPEHPVMDTNLLAQTYGVTQRQAARVVDQMTKAGIVEYHNIGGMRRGYEVMDVLNAADTLAGDDSPEEAPPGEDGASLSDDVLYESVPSSDLETQTAIRHTRGRDVCGAYMPLAKTNCVLVRGHSGAHRSTRPWRNRDG